MKTVGIIALALLCSCSMSRDILIDENIYLQTRSNDSVGSIKAKKIVSLWLKSRDAIAIKDGKFRVTKGWFWPDDYCKETTIPAGRSCEPDYYLYEIESCVPHAVPVFETCSEHACKYEFGRTVEMISCW